MDQFALIPVTKCFQTKMSGGVTVFGVIQIPILFQKHLLQNLSNMVIVGSNTLHR